MSTPRPIALRSLVVVLAAFGLFATGACERAGGGRSWAAGGKGDEEKALGVEVVSLEPANIERHYQTSGLLQALRTADIVALQTGVIEDLQVEEGDTVESDQVLAKLDGRQLKLQAAANKLQVQNLERELERLESVAGAVSREEIDKQRYAVLEAQASAKLASHQAKLTLVRAPFAGTITKRHVDEGNLAGATAPLFTLEDLSRLQVELHLPERESSRVKPGSRVALELSDGTKFEADIVRKAPVVDAMTGTVKYTVETAEPPDGAIPGAFVRAFVLVESATGAPSLPASAVFDVDGKPNVYVITEGVARRTPVEVGVEGSERIEIRGGLSDDAVVVRNGSGGITEGMALRPMPGDAPTKSGS